MRSLSVKKSESMVRVGKPLKRLAVAALQTTGLKAGVNKRKFSLQARWADVRRNPAASRSNGTP
jgi:hypothetical protein